MGTTSVSNPSADKRVETAALDYGDFAFTLWDDNLQINQVGGESVTMKLDEARALRDWLSKVLL